jgi:cystathionine gamma-lyase
MTIVDICEISKFLKEKHPKIIFVIENTLMTPYFQKPLKLGADIVVHSVTKYINGHSDILMGAAVTNSSEIFQELKFHQNAMGIVPSPFDCFLAIRGVKTLHLRMESSQKNAIQISSFLENHPKIERVLYPGLKSHPQYELGKSQTTGFGGMMTVFINGNDEATKSFLNHLKLFTIAESLGGVESLIQWPYFNVQWVPEEFKFLFKVNMVRISVGIEDVEDLIEDLSSSLEKI